MCIIIDLYHSMMDTKIVQIKISPLYEHVEHLNCLLGVIET